VLASDRFARSFPRPVITGSIGVALLVGVVGVPVAGWAASRFATWYSWSTFEGAAGYAVVAWALLGGILSFVLGLVAARTVGVGAQPFVRATGHALGILLGVVAPLLAAGRLLADVEPELDGETVHVVVEARWPAGRAARPPAQPVELRLGALSMGVVRVHEPGLLWTDAARRVDGRWTAAGVVPLFTERGARVVDVVLDTAAVRRPRFDLSLGRTPTAADTAWSAWLRPRPGATEELELRWRVLPRGRVVRTDTIGPYSTELVVRGFSWRTVAGGALGLAADGAFTLRHRGAVVRLHRPRAAADDTGATELHDVAVVGPGPALLVATPGWGDGGQVALVSDDGGRLRVRHVTGGFGWELEALPATNDAARFREAPHRARLGRPDRWLLAEPGLYVVGDALLDTRTLAVHPLPADTSLVVERSAPPLALSPDERAVARYAERPAPIVDDGDLSTLHERGGAGPQPLLLVADAATGRATTVPLDRARMRYPSPAELDPAWVAHHFAWTRDADGAARLVERAFAPLPHRGRVTEETRGHPYYWIAPGTERLRAAVVALLVAEFDGTELEPSAGGYAHRVGVGDRVISISLDDDGTIGVALELGDDDAGLVHRIAARFDAELATGRHDGAFRR